MLINTKQQTCLVSDEAPVLVCGTVVVVVMVTAAAGVDFTTPTGVVDLAVVTLTDAVPMVTAAVVEIAAGICTGLISPFGICIMTWRKYCGFLLPTDVLLAL